MADGPKGIAEVARKEAEELADVIGAKMTQAAGALVGPSEARVEDMLPATDLPEVPGEDSLARLSTRLDREADFFRALAVRELAAAAWVERLTFVGAIVLAMAAVGVAAALVFAVVIGGENAGGRALLGVVALAALAFGAASVALLGRGPRAARLGVARDALDRARDVESKIEGLTILFEWRRQSPTLYQDALARAERVRDR
jgi:hypothetical protein